MSTQAPYNLQRFLDAQSAVYDDVVHELSNGRKTSHWMWFVFPQIRGLGHSSTAQRFAISSLDEARAYLAHPLLGARLRECTSLVLQIQNRSVDQIFGFPDNLKLRSSMTLFAEASQSASSDRQLFSSALQEFFDGVRDPRTLSILNT